MTDEASGPVRSADRSNDDELLQAFVDGELADAAQADIARRIEADPALARRVTDYAHQKRQLASALADAAVGSADPYTAALADGLARRLSPPRFRWLRHFAVACALFAIGWWGHDLARTLDDPVPDQVADAAEIHELFAEDVQHPVEFSAAESVVLADWMSRQLGEDVAVPNLSGLGLRFLGGRLLGREEGPFAQLVYEGADGGRLSVYLARPLDGEDERIQVVQLDGLSAGYWQEDDLAYTIVAELSGERLLTIATRLGADGPL